VSGAASARVYLIEGSLSPAQVRLVTDKLLADPVVEVATDGVAATKSGSTLIEVHPLPGVMDPAAQSVQESIRDLTGVEVRVSTGTRYDLDGLDKAHAEPLAKAALANPVVHQITTKPFHPSELPKGHAYQFKKIVVPLRTLTDEQLLKLSKDGHLFLNLQEMQAIRSHYQTLDRDPTDIELETLAQTWSEHCVHKTLKATVRYVEGRDERASYEEIPNALSHAAHRPGHTRNPDGSITIHNLLKSTVAAATHELIKDGIDWTLSVFRDNSGVIAFDEHWAVNIKVETHNRPSAIEPYGGAATGIGGCIRDVIATGLGAKPIASTDVFCVADPKNWTANSETKQSATARILPPGVLPPKRVLQDVVAGVRDYGNRMGIPTVSGGVFFDDRYIGNPLVFCGCIGLIPRDLVKGKAHTGDRIIALGGRTGRDGIHGATFSSAELQSTSATEFAHAVQIGNAIEEKRLLDAVMRARAGAGHLACGVGGSAKHPVNSPVPDAQSPKPLYSGLTDCGAGGFSSAIGEMASELGARVTLETARTKYAGLSYTEVWISEAQERIVLAVPPANVPALQRICDEEGVELADLGEFGATNAQGQPGLILTYKGNHVGELSMHFLHEGLPNPTREALWGKSWHANEQAIKRTSERKGSLSHAASMQDALPRLLSHPTIASKHWIIRQYDHEVQGNTLIKPLIGPDTRGPSDAAVVEPVPGSRRGLAISQGLQSSVGDPSLPGNAGDPYWMTLASIDECVRNLVCVGADPSRIAILDNFCWASCEKPENLGALVRAAWGCYDGAKAYRVPFVSGKDSLSNQLRYTDPATGEQRLIEIPPTLLITGMGIVSDVSSCVTMDAKKPGRALIMVGGQDADTEGGLLGSTHAQLFGLGNASYENATGTDDALVVPRVSLKGGPNAAKLVHELIKQGIAKSVHDCSEGGMLVAVAEMLIAGSTKDNPIGASLTLHDGESETCELFGEAPSRYVIEIDDDDDTLDAISELVFGFEDVGFSTIGKLDDSGELSVLTNSGNRAAWNVEDLAKAWLSPLDW